MTSDAVDILLQLAERTKKLRDKADPVEAKKLYQWVTEGRGLITLTEGLSQFYASQVIDVCMDPVADLKTGWPELYAKIAEQEWFQKLAAFYYASDGTSLLRHEPIAKVWQVETDEEVEAVVKAVAPSDPRWWILPHTCHLTNGVFLYFVLQHEGYKPRIFESEGHVFLRDQSNTIYDLYWQPLGITGKDYKEAKEVDPTTFWERYDFLRWLQAAKLVE
ncbi:Hypothetical protein POVN_LOCUS313 [uncultured virus]|nr:Hypothetical protein POVN_LOCUS313 [uncultured virus]